MQLTLITTALSIDGLVAVIEMYFFQSNIFHLTVAGVALKSE